MPRWPLPFKNGIELEACVNDVIGILNEHGYPEWAKHLKSADVNAANPYHAAYQTASVVKHILQQNFVKYLGIQQDLKRIYKYCHRMSKSYTGNFDYIIDLIEPIAKILRHHKYIDLAENLSNGPYTSQSACECAGVTRDAAQDLLKQKWIRKLGIQKDLKKILKFCQSALRA